MAKIIGNMAGSYVGVAAGFYVGGVWGGIVGGAIMSMASEEMSTYIYEAIYINSRGINSDYPLPFQYQSDFNNHYNNFWGTY